MDVCAFSKDFISVEQARKIAEEAASPWLSSLVKNPSIPLLSEHYIEAEHCWIFFRNKDIFIPSDRPFSSGAYAVSKKGSY